MTDKPTSMDGLPFVRLAAPFDTQRIIEISEIGFSEHGDHYPGAEYPFILHFIIDQIYKNLVWVVEVDGEIIGVSMLNVRSWPWNPKAQFLQNDHLFVLKEHRNTGASDLLVEAMKDFAQEQKAHLMLSFTYGTGLEIVNRFMEKHEAKPIGGNFWFGYSEEPPSE